MTRQGGSATARNAVRPAEIRSLTAARGVAALLVVFYHVRASLPPELNWFDKGYLAVDFFFVLSGFVMWLCYGASGAIRDMRSAGAFIASRWLRIYPLHGVVLAAMVLFALMLELAGKPGSAQYPWSMLPAHVLLVQDWGFIDAMAWNDPAWSLSAESGAYFVFALACILLRGAGVRPIMLATGAMAVLIGWFAVRQSPTLGDDISGDGLMRCLAQFALGLAVCQAWLAGHWARLAVILLGLAGAGWALVAIGTVAFEPAVLPPLLALGVLLLARFDAAAPVRAFARLFLPLGRISYSVYLTHFFGWTIFKLLFVDDLAAITLGQIGLFVAMVLAVSTLSYRLIEVELRLWLSRRLLTGQRERAPAASLKPEAGAST